MPPPLPHPYWDERNPNDKCIFISDTGGKLQKFRRAHHHQLHRRRRHLHCIYAITAENVVCQKV